MTRPSDFLLFNGACTNPVPGRLSIFMTLIEQTAGQRRMKSIHVIKDANRAKLAIWLFPTGGFSY